MNPVSKTNNFLNAIEKYHYRDISPHLFQIDFTLPKSLVLPSPQPDGAFVSDGIPDAGKVSQSVTSLRQSNQGIMTRLNMSLESCIFPGRSLNSIPRTTGGPIREIPYESLYGGDIEFTFKIGRNFFERNLFDVWMDTIASKTHRFKYYDDYTTNIHISATDRKGNIVYTADIYECYPKTIAAINLSQQSSNEFVLFSVSMAYRKYNISYVNGSNQSQMEWPTSLEGDKSINAAVTPASNEGQTTPASTGTDPSITRNF